MAARRPRGRAPARGAAALALALLLLPAAAPSGAAPEGPADVGAEALAFAEAHRALWGLHPQARFALAAVRGSLTADHAWVTQAVGGARVEDGGLAYHQPRDGSAAFATVRFAALEQAPPAVLRAEPARALGLAALGGPALRAEPALELVRGPDGAPAWLLRAPAAAPPRDLEARVDARTGAVLAVRDISVRADGVGAVFRPNPIASSGNAALRDNPLGLSSPELAAEVQEVALRGLSEAPGDAGFLAGPHVRVAGAAFEPSLAFRYERHDPRFEEVMAYHHIDEAQRQVQALGFADLARRPTLVNNYPGEANAFYLRLTRSVHFGYHFLDPGSGLRGPADAAEDGEIIVHEYGHAVLDDIVPAMAGPAGDAIHEGFADFFAASTLSRWSGGNFDACFAEWLAQYIPEYDGGQPPCLRRLDSFRRYPDDFHGGVLASPHENGLIWAGALWDLWQRHGLEDVQRVAIEAHFFLATVPAMPDLGQAVLRANALLGAPLPEASIAEVMGAHGILGVPLAPQDDAGTGGDAGNHWRAATPRGPGAYDGRVGAAGDREDWYRFALRAGDILVLDIGATGAGTPGLVGPTDPPLYGQQAGSAGRLANPAFRVLGPASGCDAGAGDLRLYAVAPADGEWRLFFTEPPENDLQDPHEAPYAFRARVERELAAVLPAPAPEVGAGTVRVTAEDSVYLRLDGAGSATLTAPNGATLAVRKAPALGVAIAHVALDGRVLGVRVLTGGEPDVRVEGDLAGAPADGTWVVRKGLHENSGMPLGLQLRVAGKVLDDVAPTGDPIEGEGKATMSAMATPTTLWNWHKAPARFDASSNDTVVPRPPVSPMCPRLLTG